MGNELRNPARLEVETQLIQSTGTDVLIIHTYMQGP